MENIEIHIGELIRKELFKQERSIKWLADCIEYDRGNLHRHLCKAEISHKLLIKICIALHTDFFIYYSNYISNKIDVENTAI